MGYTPPHSLTPLRTNKSTQCLVLTPYRPHGCFFSGSFSHRGGWQFLWAVTAWRSGAPLAQERGWSLHAMGEEWDRAEGSLRVQGWCRGGSSLHPYTTGTVQRKLLPESHSEGRGRTQLFYSIPCRQLKHPIWEQSRQLFNRVDKL